MPSLNLMVWNSRGENAAKAAFLQNLILNNPVVHGWQPDIIAIQEALAAPGGALWAMLAGLGNVAGGNNYALNPPQFVALQGEGYILKVSNNVAFARAFQRVNLAGDAGVVNAINTQMGPNKPTAQQEVAAMRQPGDAVLTAGGRRIPFMTWHAPRGPGQLLHGPSAAVNYDAYYFLQSSNFYNGLCAPGAGNLSLIGGDLNVTPMDLAAPTGLPAPIDFLLPNWDGVSNGLDHLLARGDGGAGGIHYQHAGHHATGGLSDHDVLVATVHWP